MAAKNQKFKCIYCKTNFDDETRYYNHRDQILCMCEFCAKIFKDTTQFNQHLTDHTSNGICALCAE